MPVRTILGALTFVACLLQIPAVMHGQSSAQSTPPAGQVFSLGATSSLVIEDVVVTDGKGHPVDSLPPIAFHVQDQTAHQKILHFEHATTASTAQRAAPDPPGEFSNAALTNPGGDVVVFLFDDVDIELEDQMYLRLQMLKYLATVPPGKEVAVFVTNGGTQHY